MMEKTFTTYQVAKIFDVEQKTVRRWIKNSKLAGFQTPGGHWRIPASEVERFKAQGGAR